jgi:hypothetical protein
LRDLLSLRVNLAFTVRVAGERLTYGSVRLVLHCALECHGSIRQRRDVASIIAEERSVEHVSLRCEAEVGGEAQPDMEMREEKCLRLFAYSPQNLPSNLLP